LTSDPEIVIAAVKPSAPLNVTATTNGNRQSVISWSVPASNGGSEIIGYTVTSNTNATCTTSTTSCTISGLANGTAYTFTVAATNNVGTSVASTSASATTAAIYSVIFDSRGGTSVSNGSFLAASTVDEPTAPTRSGYIFAGWSVTDGGSVISFPYAPGVLSAVTLYARWNVVSSGGSPTPITAIPLTAAVTVIGAKEAKISIWGAFTPTSATNLKPAGVKFDEISTNLIADLKVVDGKLILVPKIGFSGKKTVTLTITDDGVDRSIQVPLIVLPEAVTKPIFTPTSARRSVIRWSASPNASAYAVYSSGKRVCSTTLTSCSVAKLFGPSAVIEVVSNGGDRTASQKVEAEFSQSTSLLVTRLVSDANTKSSLTVDDRKALVKVIALIKSQGYRSIVISRISTTKKTESLEAARIAVIKKYIIDGSGVKNLTFEVVPASSKTVFNNILVKG
jgi:uncharacterized repeat protein (TIGR02543 family)